MTQINPSSAQKLLEAEQAREQKLLAEIEKSRVKQLAFKEVVDHERSLLAISGIEAEDETLEEALDEGLTKAIEWVVKNHAPSRGMSTGEIKEVLSKHKYKYTVAEKNVSIAVHKTLQRLLESKRITGWKDGDFWVYGGIL